MKSASRLGKLLKELSRDLRVKKLIAKARRQARGQARAKVENVTGMLVLALTVVSRFSKKRKARKLDELRETLYLLVQLSLLLKENIFDRPEVREFFSRRSKQLYSLAQTCLATILPKTTEADPSHVSRSI